MKYPLCARAGLEFYSRYDIHARNTMGHRIFIPAAEVEKLLEGAPVVYGVFDNGKPCCWSYVCDTEGSKDTHAARLIMIEPIVKDTAESLLREFEKIFATSTLGRGEHILERRISINDEGKAWDLLDRARRLLEGK